MHLAVGAEIDGARSKRIAHLGGRGAERYVRTASRDGVDLEAL